jgi:hypothetical protein
MPEELGLSSGQQSHPNFEFVPLYKPEAIFRAWPVVADGVQEILNVSVNEDFTRILNAILAGDLLLWLMFLNGKYVGFVCTSIEVVPTNPITRTLWINHAYKLPGIRRQSDYHTSVLSQAHVAFMKFARENDCDYIAFKTTRADLGKRATGLGFEATYTEYRGYVHGIE